MNNHRKYIFFSFISILILSFCASPPNKDIEGIEIDVDFYRTDKLMTSYINQFNDGDSNQDYRNNLLQERGFFLALMGIDSNQAMTRLGTQGVDSLIMGNIGGLLESKNMEFLGDTISKRFLDNYPFEERLAPVLKRLKKHFPTISFPKFRTHINGYNQDASIQSIDQILLLPGYVSIGLHYFLGDDFPYYPATIPKYIKSRFRENYIEVALVKEIAKELVPLPSNRSQPTLLKEMIHKGINQHLLQTVLPHIEDSIRLAYTSDQMQWADHFEAQIFKEIIQHLYKTDYKLQLEYIGEKPYTSSLTDKSAPRLGEFCGWKIVNAYMEKHPNVSLEELCEETDYEKIFREAKYKP